MIGDREPVETPGVEPVEIVDLADRLTELRAARANGEQRPAGRLLGLPELPGGDVWVDIAGAAAIAGVQPRTITSWLSRQRPAWCPFPRPHRLLYRSYWPASTIEAWNHEARKDRNS